MTSSTADGAEDIPFGEYILRPASRTGLFFILAGPVVWWLLSNIVALAEDGLLTGYGAVCLTLFALAATHKAVIAIIPVSHDDRESAHEELSRRAITMLAVTILALPGVLSFKFGLKSILSAPKSGALVLPVVALVFSAVWMVACMEAMAEHL